MVGWLWLRHGAAARAARPWSARSSPALGLVLVLDLLSGADLSLVGVAVGARRDGGAAFYFVISADDDNGLPPHRARGRGPRGRRRRAAALAGLVGLLPMDGGDGAGDATQGLTVAWWVPCCCSAW